METVAIYWEKEIRIYGVIEHSGLSLIELILPPDHLSRCGAWLAEPERSGLRFELVLGEEHGSDGFKLNLLVEENGEAALFTHLQERVGPTPGGRLLRHAPVALIVFHGPHFQDRFGIVDAATRLLDRLGATVLLCGCAGTSVSLVIPEAEREAVVAAIGAAFPVPQGRG